MKPPYVITSKSLQLISSISIKIGEVNAKMLVRQNPKLRKQNKIKTIQSSLAIEGNTLSEEQITALLENKRVVGPAKDIKEVLNAFVVYEQLSVLRHTSEQDFLKAHNLLMKGLVEQPGKYRNQSVGIVKGSKIAHVAPPHTSVSLLMKDLFEYLKDQSELTLIKSCVFHYEMEFIHPFMDGNGRMGRLWQTLILMKAYPLFEFLPFESLISNNQSSYYEALALSDKAGKSTIFIEYMLGIIDKSLDQLLQQRTKKLNEIDRLSIFLGTMDGVFTRKEYMNFFAEISSATASRDLKNGVDMHILERYGEKKTTQYKKI